MSIVFSQQPFIDLYYETDAGKFLLALFFSLWQKAGRIRIYKNHKNHNNFTSAGFCEYSHWFFYLFFVCDFCIQGTTVLQTITVRSFLFEIEKCLCNDKLQIQIHSILKIKPLKREFQKTSLRNTTVQFEKQIKKNQQILHKL